MRKREKNVRNIVFGMAMLPDGRIEETTVVWEGGRILEILAGNRYKREARQLPSGWLLSPGLIDLQVNGCLGSEMRTDPSTVAKLQQFLPTHGVTAFCPTVTSIAVESYDGLLEKARTFREPSGATVIGFHLEGPFLNEKFRGGHPAEYVRAPSTVDISTFARDTDIRLVTLAPELEGSMDAIRQLDSRGICVGIGHSDADVDQVVQAKESGAKWITHLFNAMRQATSRDPGVVGAGLTEPGLAVGVIADGIHLHPRLLALAFQCKASSGELLLVTDGSAATGLPPGEHKTGERTFISDGVSARQPDGRLVGSILTLDVAVRNIVKLAGRPVAEALRAATATPADLAGVGRKKGRLAAEFDADVVVLSDALVVQETWVGGTQTYRAA